MKNLLLTTIAAVVEDWEILFGFVLAAVMLGKGISSIVKGKIRNRKKWSGGTTYVERDERPIAFWSSIIFYIVAGTGVLVAAIYYSKKHHFF